MASIYPDCYLMANRSWNIRGLNASGKWDAVREKIEESACSILCLQETKKEHFDSRFISNFAPRRFDSFEYIPFWVLLAVF
jgi:exonuclease III